MARLKEREEKKCLNCGAIVHGRYCHVCGQENIEPKESFWHLATHFIDDITHYDSKFFNTLRYLLLKPGFLSQEYLIGRRNSYLHPIRMYVFVSAFFFLIFFSTESESDKLMHSNANQNAITDIVDELEERKTEYTAMLKDTVFRERRGKILQKIAQIDSDFALIRRDTAAKYKLKSLHDEDDDLLFFEKHQYATVKAYDSVQAGMLKEQRDGFLIRNLTRQQVHLNEKYNHNWTRIWEAITYKVNHLFPKMLFLSLPLFALLLKLLYIRSKRFYYVSHAIFTIHLYCATFILILAQMGVSWICKVLHLNIAGWIAFLFWLLGLFYWYKSIQRFYGQEKRKTRLKYGLIMLLFALMMSLIFLAFIIFSAMTI